MQALTGIPVQGKLGVEFSGANTCRRSWLLTVLPPQKKSPGQGLSTRMPVAGTRHAGTAESSIATLV